jgi:hypothetical protein
MEDTNNNTNKLSRRIAHAHQACWAKILSGCLEAARQFEISPDN